MEDYYVGNMRGIGGENGMMNRTDNYFDGQFQDYDEEKGNGWGMNWRAYMILRCDVILSRLKEEIATRHPRKILEIGCATGDFTKRYLPFFKDSNTSVLGVDISEKAVTICERIFAEEEYCSFATGRLPELGLQEEFDIILCMDVMEYFDISDRDECYRNICSHISTGGGLLLQAPLAGENTGQFVEQVSKYFSIQKIDYVYGQLWYEIAEVWLYKLVEALYFEKRISLFYFLGAVAYKIMSSRSIVSFFFLVNRFLFPHRRSHIVLTCIPKRNEFEVME